MYNHLERRKNIWGLGYDQRQKFVDVGRARDLRSGEARRAGLARMRRRVRGRLPEVAAVALRHSAREERPLRRAVEGAVHGRSGQAHRQRIHVPGAGAGEHRRAEGGGPEEDPHVVPALREDDRRRLPAVRLRGRDRPLVGVRRRAAARCAAGCLAAGRAHDRHVPRSVLSRTLCRQGRRAARTADEVRRRRRKEPERNRDNPFCCGAGGGLLFADKEEEPGSRISDVRFKQLHGHRREHGRHRVSVLFDHAEGRADERAGKRRPVRRSDDVRARSPPIAKSPDPPIP